MGINLKLGLKINFNLFLNLSFFAELDKKIESELIKLSGVTPGRTLQSLRDAVKDAESEASSLANDINAQRDNLNDYQEQTSKLERELNGLQAEKVFIYLF